MSLSNQADSWLWQRFKEGDEDVLEHIYMVHYPQLINYGLRLCPDEELVKDSIHDLFLELWKYRQGLSPTDSIRFYLLKVLRNKILAQHKTIQQKHDINLYAESYSFEVEYSFEEQLIRQIGDEEVVTKLKDALNKLSPRQKEALYHRFYNNLDYPEIASIMGVNYQSTRTLVYQAIKSLREQLSMNSSKIIFIVTLLFSILSKL